MYTKKNYKIIWTNYIHSRWVEYPKGITIVMMVQRTENKTHLSGLKQTRKVDLGDPGSLHSWK